MMDEIERKERWEIKEVIREDKKGIKIRMKERKGKKHLEKERKKNGRGEKKREKKKKKKRKKKKELLGWKSEVRIK